MTKKVKCTFNLPKPHQTKRELTTHHTTQKQKGNTPSHNSYPTHHNSLRHYRHILHLDNSSNQGRQRNIHTSRHIRTNQNNNLRSKRRKRHSNHRLSSNKRSNIQHPKRKLHSSLTKNNHGYTGSNRTNYNQPSIRRKSPHQSLLQRRNIQRKLVPTTLTLKK